MSVRIKVICVIAVLGLSGCASSPSSITPPMSIPLQASTAQQVQLAQIEQMFARSDMSQEDVAQLHYERGLLYDSLGLGDLARMSLNHSLSLKSNQPNVFNILGVYLTQATHFDAAYEAFDSSLELNALHPYAQRNRGIALYYGGRFELSHQDLLQHYQQEPNDPYRSIWLYLVDLQQSPDQAKQALQARYLKSDQTQWGWNIARYYAGELAEAQLLMDIRQQSKDNVELAQRLTEAYFYIGKQKREQQNLAAAVHAYKLALSNNVYDFVEHRYALLELILIQQTVLNHQLSATPDA